MPAEKLTLQSSLDALHRLADPNRLPGMARYGINTASALGVSMPNIRQLAHRQHDHSLALELWASGIHEARILASLVDIPSQVTLEQMESWALDFNSWDLCDQVCGNLFDRTPFAVPQALAWAEREEEFVRRAGFVLMAGLAIHDKKAADGVFLQFLPVIAAHATDSRNFVKKAVNWALRGIGKRNAALRLAAMETAAEIYKLNSPTARWIAADALRELKRISR